MKERERERKGGRKRGRERVRGCVCVYVRIRNGEREIFSVNHIVLFVSKCELLAKLKLIVPILRDKVCRVLVERRRKKLFMKQVAIGGT